MPSLQPKPMVRALNRRLASTSTAAAGWLAVGLLNAIRVVPRARIGAFAGATMRKLGPLLREHRVGQANLQAAFPEKSALEIERILAGVWDNLGRAAVEFAHIDRLTVSDPPLPTDDIVAEPIMVERFHRLRLSGKPALLFGSHLANWELAPIVGARHGVEHAILYRRPNIRPIADAIEHIRADIMGTLVSTGLAAPVQLLRELEANRVVGMLIDQYFVKGVEVSFFERTCKVNPLIAHLARHIDCPIHGTRVIRRKDRNRFRIEITDPIEPARDAEGRIEIAGTMQAIMSVVEGWVREHPDQWLWLHRMWR
jgi:KDO2-lipid IV(A) lauroyltransferase